MLLNLHSGPNRYKTQNNIGRMSEFLLMIGHLLLCTYLNEDENEEDRIMRGWFSIGIWSFIVLVHFSYFMYMGIKELNKFF